MKEMLKRPSVIGALIGFIVAVFAFAAALAPVFMGEKDHLSKQATQVELIIGFLALWVTCILTIILQHLETEHEFRNLHQQSRKAAESSHIELLQALQLGVNLGKDDWLKEKAVALSKLRQELTDSHTVLEIKTKFDEFFRRMQRGVFEQEYQKTEEVDRMNRLLRAIKDAQKYVYAVTLDSGTYLEDFWQGSFAKKYIQANNEVANDKRVDIRRIFVVDENLLSDPMHIHRKLLGSLIAAQGSDGSDGDVRVRIVSKERLRGSSWARHDTSFLVCDDILASESYSLSDGGATPGYVVLNNAEKIERLRNLFHWLDTAPEAKLASTDQVGESSAKG